MFCSPFPPLFQIKLQWGAFGYFSSTSVRLLQQKTKSPRGSQSHYKNTSDSMIYGKIKKERNTDDTHMDNLPETGGVVKMRRSKHSVTGVEIREALGAMKEEKELKPLKRSDGRYTFTNPFLHGVVMRLVSNMGIGGQVCLVLSYLSCVFLTCLLLS
jgi:hypothetical protein